MDWKKWLMSGIKQIVYLLIGALIYVIIGSLTTALGFKPEAGLQTWIWDNAVYPAIVAIIAWVKNWWQHRNQTA